jgi:hypothetical protein
MCAIVDRCFPWRYGDEYMSAIPTSRASSPSRGRLHQISVPGWRRTMHFLSAAEMRVAVWVIYQPAFIECLENRPCMPIPGYPVLDGHPQLRGKTLNSSSGTVELARCLGIKHPMACREMHPKSTNDCKQDADYFPIVSDLLCLLKSETSLRAVNLFIKKRLHDFELDPRHSDLFRLERAYYLEADIPTKQICEEQLHPIVTNNLVRLVKLGMPPADLTNEQIALVLDFMQERIYRSAPVTWVPLLYEKFGLSFQSVFRIFHYGVLRRYLKIDLQKSGRNGSCSHPGTGKFCDRVRVAIFRANSMSCPASVGTCITFKEGFGDFCASRRYAVVAVHSTHFLLVAIDFRRPQSARYIRRLKRTVYPSLLEHGAVMVEPLPKIPNAHLVTICHGDDKEPNEKAARRVAARLKKLQPLIAAKNAILTDINPERKCNELALRSGLNQTRARQHFFWLAAFDFDAAALIPAYWNTVGTKENQDPNISSVGKKRGPKVKSPELIPPGWAFDKCKWPALIMAGWKSYARPGVTYQKVYAQTLLHKFGCKIDPTSTPARIFHPNGETFPSRRQFCNYVMKTIGRDAWLISKFGEQTIRNKRTSSVVTIAENLVNLLEEVQWDGQILPELPADIRDPSQPGRPIVRIDVICGVCGGPVGVGYDYGAESKWGYLMALLSMAMNKSDFCALFGLEISDEDWPAYGIMAAVRGDRGPAIGRSVTEIVSEVLGVWQEWAASYDPIGKANAEAGHYKSTKVEGKPRRPSVFRSPMEIIRDDLRRTVAKFRSADMSHRLDPEQARRLPVGTPRMIWNDLVKRGLYAGQIVPYESLIPVVLPCHDVSIHEDGVHLGGLRYLSPELETSGLLEKARGDAIPAKVYAMNMAIKHIWLPINNTLLRLTAVPKRFNAMDISHNLTLDESLLYQERMAESRRLAEQEALALEMYNEMARIKDHDAIEEARRRHHSYRSSGKAETVRQHRQVFKRK